MPIDNLQDYLEVPVEAPSAPTAGPTREELLGILAQDQLIDAAAPAPADGADEFEFEPDVLAPLPVEDPGLDIEAAPPPVADDVPPTEAPQVSPVASAATAIETTQKQLASLEGRKAELLAEYGQEADPAKRMEIAKRVAAIEASAGERRAQLQQQRTAYDEEATVADAELQQKAREAQLASKERVSQELATIAKRERSDAAQYETAKREAADDVATAKQAVQAKLKAGPAQGASWGVMMADVLAEGINASMQRRPVNLDKIFDRYAQQNAQTFARELQAEELGVEIAGDRVSELARQAEQARVDAQIAKAAIAEEVERSLDLQISRATTGAQAAQLLGVRDLARRTREQAMIQAQAAAEESYLKRELQKAQIAKTRADAAKAMRAAAGGPSRTGEGGFGVQRSTAVTLPGTNEVIADFAEGRTPTTQEVSQAKEARTVMADVDNFIRYANEYEAMLEDFGQRGLLDREGFTETPEFRRLETARSGLSAPYAKMLASGYNPSAQMEERAKQILSSAEGWWQKEGVALAGLREIKRAAEENAATRLEAAGLRPEVVQRWVAHRRKRSEGRKDIRGDFVSRAAEVAADPNADPKDRVAGLDVVEDRAKAAADAQGREGQWRVDASRELVDIYRSALAEPESNGRNRVLRSNARKLAEIRARLEKEREAAENKAREAGINVRSGVRTVSAQEERDAVESATRQYTAAIREIDAAFAQGIGDDLRDLTPRDAVKKIRKAHKNPGKKEEED